MVLKDTFQPVEVSTKGNETPRFNPGQGLADRLTNVNLAVRPLATDNKMVPEALLSRIVNLAGVLGTQTESGRSAQNVQEIIQQAEQLVTQHQSGEEATDKATFQQIIQNLNTIRQRLMQVEAVVPDYKTQVQQAGELVNILEGVGAREGLLQEIQSQLENFDQTGQLKILADISPGVVNQFIDTTGASSNYIDGERVLTSEAFPGLKVVFKQKNNSASASQVRIEATDKKQTPQIKNREYDDMW